MTGNCDQRCKSDNRIEHKPLLSFLLEKTVKRAKSNKTVMFESIIQQLNMAQPVVTMLTANEAK